MRFGYFDITERITDLVIGWLSKNNHPRARREENIREYILVIGITIEKHLTVLGIIRLTVMFEDTPNVIRRTYPTKKMVRPTFTVTIKTIKK